jgi:hypothetical protein
MADPEIKKIRRLLQEAGESAEQIGDEPNREPAGTGYFSTPKSSGVDAAIKRIAEQDGKITMFVGAGVSTESELPSWNQLVRTLLADTDVAKELSDDDRELWMRATVTQGPLAAAAIARAHHRDDLAFRRALRAALYGGSAPDEYRPGALAGQIAWLKRQMGARLRLVTANYDGLLEIALEEEGLTPIAYVENKSEPISRAAVWHLHGRLMKNASGKDWMEVGRLVLTEGDYADSAHSKWPEEFVADCLESSLCVFVGLSMTDPNFIRWLYRYSNSECQHLAVFVRQASTVPNDDVRDGLEKSAEARWERAGVRPVWTNYFGEVAQFVHEVGLNTVAPESKSFAVRAQERLEVARNGLMPSSPTEFVDAQEELAGWLIEQVQSIRKIAGALDVSLAAEEDLGLGLWVADHARGVAELWGTSEQIWLDRRAIEERPLHVNSRWVGVRAMIQGVPVEQDPAVYTTRWRFIRGIPLVVQAPGRSLVGSLTLTSATPLSKCLLSVGLASRELLEVIDQGLSEAAEEFFV